MARTQSDQDQETTRGKFNKIINDAIKPGEEDQMEAAARDSRGNHESAGSLKNKEENASQGAPTKDNQTSQPEQLRKAEKAPGDGLYSGANPKTSQRKKFRLGRKGKAGTIIITIVIGVGGYGAMQGPTILINHLREMLLNGASNLQTNQQWKYRRKVFHRIGDVFTKDGRRGGRIIAEMENYHYKFQFDESGKMIGITTPRGVSIPADRVAEQLDRFMTVAHPFRSFISSRWKTKRMEAFYTRYKVSRQIPVAVRTTTDPEDPNRAANKRIAEQIFGEHKDVKISGRLTPAEGTPEEERARIENSLNVNEQIAKGDNSYGNIKQQLLDGTPVEEIMSKDPDAKHLLNPDTPTQGLIDVAERATQGSVGDRMFTTVKSFVNSTDILDKVCTIKVRLNAVEKAGRTTRALSMLQYASVFIILADKVHAGKLTPGTIDPGLVNSVMGRITSLDSNGKAFGESPGLSYLMNGKFSKSQNDAVRSNVSVDGKLTGVPGALQRGTNIPGTSMGQCSVYQNPAFQIGTTVVDVGIGVVTGGGGTAISAGAKTGVKEVVKASLERIISKQFAKEIAKGSAIGAIQNLTFEGVIALTQIYAEKAFALNFTGQEKGGELANVLAGGSGTLRKQRGLMAGMVPATTSQYRQALTAYNNERNEYLKSQSLYARVFDYNNTDSLAYRLTTKLAMMPWSAEGIRSMASDQLAHIMYRITNPSSLFSGLGNIFAGKALAAEPNSDTVEFDTYDANGTELVTDPAGNLQPILRDDIARIDPINNLNALKASGDIDPDTLEPKSDNFKEHIKNCVDEVDTISIIEKEDQNDPKFDCLASLEITKKYKAHLAYLDALDGWDAQLFPEELGSLTDPFDDVLGNVAIR